MADKPKKRVRHVSPKGTFKYPKLTTPDTKFKDEGEYSVTLILKRADPAAKKLMKMADDGAAESLAYAKKEKSKNDKERKKWQTKYLPYALVEDDDGNETDEVEFKFTMKASGISKKTNKPWKRQPVLFDASGQRITGDIQVWGGTQGKISFEVVPYAQSAKVTGASVKFALEAAQIIELVSGGTMTAEEAGFEAEEGYEFSGADAPADDASDDPGPSDDDGNSEAEGDF